MATPGLNFKFVPMRLSVFVPALLLAWAQGLFAEAPANGRYQIQLTGSGSLGGFTVLFDRVLTNTKTPSTNDDSLFFVSDEKGFLYSPLDEKAKDFKLIHGDYRVEVVTGKRTLKLDLKIDADTKSPIAIDVQTLMRQTKEDKVRTLTAVDARESGGFQGGSHDTITSAEARSIPGGGGDALRALFSLPGVAPQAFGSQALIVRGGGRDDILYFYDGIPIGDPFHDFGFYSVFPTSAVESVTFYPGAYPSRFGRSQGALVEILGKTSYDKTKPIIDLDVNIAAAGAYVSVPLGKYFQLSLNGRRTYYEAFIAAISGIKADFTQAIAKLLGGSGTQPFFYDVGVKLDFTPNDRHRVSAIFLAAQDRLAIDALLADSTNATTGAITTNNRLTYTNAETWDSEALLYHYQGNKIQNDLSLSRYFFTNEESLQGITIDRSIAENVMARETVNIRLSDKTRLQAGLDYFYQFMPFTVFEGVPGSNVSGGGSLFTGASPSIFVLRTNSYSQFRNSLSPFAEAEMDLGPFTLTPGLRLAWSQISNGGIGNWDLDPRVSLSLKPTKGLEFFTRFGKYSQPPPLNFTAPGYGNTNLTSAYALHYVAGGKFTAYPFEVKMEAYYKSLYNQAIQNPSYDAYYAVDQNNPRYFNNGEGRAYGLEVLLRKQLTSGLFGWLSYSLSRSERYNYLVASNYSTTSSTNLTINNGLDYQGFKRGWQVFNQDVTHNLVLIGSAELASGAVKLTPRIGLSTGKPYTEKIVTTNSAGKLILVDSADTLGARLPLTFTLDLRVDFTFKLSKKTELAIYLDIANVQYFWYKNSIFYSPSTNNLTMDMIGKPAPQDQPFAIPIIPMLGVSFKF